MSWDGHRFVLPLPTRANDLVRPALIGPKWNRKVRLVKTTNGKTWLAIARGKLTRIWHQLKRPAPMVGPVRFEVVFFFATIASDGDGRLKSLQDAISGFAYEDDRQIADWKLGKRILEAPSDDPEAPIHDRERAEVTVVDVSGWPEHEELEARLAQARKRKTSKTRRLGLQPAVYR